MNTLDAIDTRVTAGRLAEPAPSREQLERMLQAAARAPDHGRLAPWRFIVIEGAARERFGDIIVDFKRRQSPDCEPRVLDAERAKVYRAPTIVVAAARVTRGHKVPEIEQLLAVGAAVENLLLAAQALGFGSMWKTGAPAYDTQVKQSLGLQPDDHIVGFVYLGSQTGAVPIREPDLNDKVTYWGAGSG